MGTCWGPANPRPALLPQTQTLLSWGPTPPAALIRAKGARTGPAWHTMAQCGLARRGCPALAHTGLLPTRGQAPAAQGGHSPSAGTERCDKPWLKFLGHTTPELGRAGRDGAAVAGWGGKSQPGPAASQGDRGHGPAAAGAEAAPSLQGRSNGTLAALVTSGRRQDSARPCHGCTGLHGWCWGWGAGGEHPSEGPELTWSRSCISGRRELAPAPHTGGQRDTPPWGVRVPSAPLRTPGRLRRLCLARPELGWAGGGEWGCTGSLRGPDIHRAALGRRAEPRRDGEQDPGRGAAAQQHADVCTGAARGRACRGGSDARAGLGKIEFPHYFQLSSLDSSPWQRLSRNGCSRRDGPGTAMADVPPLPAGPWLLPGQGRGRREAGATPGGLAPPTPIL